MTPVETLPVPPPPCKACRRCGETKPRDEFHRNCRTNDGLNTRCKVCNNAVRRAWYAANPAHARKDAPSPESVAAYRRANRDKAKANNASYRLRYPEKVRAQNAASFAINAGVIVRQPCMVCGEVEGHAHHPDYSRPYGLVWLCRHHHHTVHQGKVPCPPATDYAPAVAAWRLQRTLSGRRRR
jgi:hypothetical protein